MKTKDILWVLGIILFSLVIIIPSSRIIFNQLTMSYPYLMGFIKTAYLATMGEMLVTRIKTKRYLSNGIHIKMLVWGFFGMVFVFIFKIFSSGVSASMEAQLFPTFQYFTLNRIWTAFLTSLTMNLFFAPTFMLLHRVTDQYIDQSFGQLKNIKNIKLNDVAKSIDMHNFIGFVVLKTIPFFWIPAHTITFLLPENYRILMAAYLSIALGIILTIAKNMKNIPAK
jgi:hypothetical protein